MEIFERGQNQAIRSIMVRLTNEQYAQLVALAKRAKCPVATFCRKVIEGALEEGIQVVARPYGEGDAAR